MTTTFIPLHPASWPAINMQYSIVFWLGIAVAIAMAGCGQPAPPHVDDSMPPTTCHVEMKPVSKTQILSAGHSYIHTPTGGAMWSASSFGFPLKGMREHLESVNITVAWDSGGLREDRMLVDVGQDGDARPFASFEGPSPLIRTILTGPELNLDDSHEIRLGVGTTNNTGLLPVSVAVVDHEITVTVQQTYRC